jgi:membrane-bound ClpP family serine protease
MINEMLQSPRCFSYLSFRVPQYSFVSFFSFLYPSSLFFILFIIGASFVIACIVIAALSRHQKSAMGQLQLEGRIAQVVQALEPEGAILVGGELWRARTRNGDEIVRGQVRIVGARGHWLEVEAIV